MVQSGSKASAEVKWPLIHLDIDLQQQPTGQIIPWMTLSAAALAMLATGFGPSAHLLNLEFLRRVMIASVGAQGTLCVGNEDIQDYSILLSSYSHTAVAFVFQLHSPSVDIRRSMIPLTELSSCASRSTGSSSTSLSQYPEVTSSEAERLGLDIGSYDADHFDSRAERTRQAEMRVKVMARDVSKCRVTAMDHDVENVHLVKKSNPDVVRLSLAA